MLRLQTSHLACQSPPGAFLDVKAFRVYAARCMKWTCASCARLKARKVIDSLGDRRFNWMLTFTAPAGTYVTKTQLRVFNNAWRRISQWLKREHPACEHGKVRHSSFRAGLTTYMWSNERGEKTGHLHKHVVADIPHWFCYACLRTAISRAGLGDVCDFKQVHSWGTPYALKYVVKYIGKGGSWVFPRYSRIFQRSRGLKPKSSSSNGAYMFLKIARPQIEAGNVNIIGPSGITCSSRYHNDRHNGGNCPFCYDLSRDIPRAKDFGLRLAHEVDGRPYPLDAL